MKPSDDVFKGYVHSVLTGATVDGPGVRFVVFLQTCPLRCKFCHNPDSWFLNKEKTKTVDELYSEILKYKNFYELTGGGITVSGGEPLMQQKFVLELFKLLKKEKIHTAIDTSGYTDLNDEIFEIFKYTDLFLLDIKHLDNKNHIELTGHSNLKVLNFLNALYLNNKKTIIRLVLIPDINTGQKYILKLINYLDKYKSIIEKIELLPYHKMGIEKWKKLGLEYTLKADEPKKEDIDAIKDMFFEHGFCVLAPS